MKLKTLLLGSAAALLTVGAAQAADLSAEPVNYVRVCDAFGPGFYYAPGTDTCIKIGGYVLFDINIGNFSGTLGTSNHYFNTEIGVNVTASSMTEYGPLIGFVNFFAISPNPLSANTGPGVLGMGAAVVDDAWLSLGPLLAGYTWSIFNPTFMPTYEHLWWFTGNTRGSQVRLSWAANGIGIAIAAEDYGARAPGNVANIPDLTAALNGSWGNIGLHIGLGYGSRPLLAVANTWGAAATVRFGLDMLAPGDALLIGANYGGNGDEWIDSFFGPFIGVDGLNHWSIYGSFVHFWTPQVSTAIAGGYRTAGGVNDMNRINANIEFRPVRNFSVGAELNAVQNGVVAGSVAGVPWVLTGKVRLKRTFP